MSIHWTRRAWLVLTAVLLAAWFAIPRAVERFQPQWRVAAQIMSARIISAFGHDVVLLIGDSRVANLGGRSIDRPQTRVFNLGLTGSRASEWRRQLARSVLSDHAAIVLWLGVNDVWHHDTKPVAVVDDLRETVAALAARGHRVILLSQIPADARVGPVHTRITEASRVINAMFETEPPQALVLPVADLFQVSAATGTVPRLYDGIHLTAEGNEQIWRRITSALETQQADRKP